MPAVTPQASCWGPAGLTPALCLPGNISKNCTSHGWSEMFPDFVDACGYSDAEDDSKVRARAGPVLPRPFSGSDHGTVSLSCRTQTPPKSCFLVASVGRVPVSVLGLAPGFGLGFCRFGGRRA